MKGISRILMTADAVGGVWTYALELMRAFPEVKFALATMGSPISPAQHVEVSQLANVEIFSSGFALEWMHNPWADVDRASDWLLQIASEFEPDLVHLNGYAHAALPWKVPVLIVAHSCVVSWWDAVKKIERPARVEEYQRRVAEGLSAADLVVAPTQAMLESLGPNYSFFGPSCVIPNARDGSRFVPGLKRPNIFAAGRVWDEAKNLSALAAIADRVTWPIEIAGDSVDPDGRSVELANVVSLGKLPHDELAAHLASSAIYALPARYERSARELLRDAGIDYAGWWPNYRAPEVFARFKITVHVPRRPYVEALRGIPTIRPFEALACGIPLVCSPWEDSEKLFEAGKDFLVARDGAEMKKHLRALLADKQMARALADHGLQTIRARHTCAHRVDELLNIVAQVSNLPSPDVRNLQSCAT